MRLLFVTDLHGCQWKYDRLLQTAQVHHADVVINGGDLLPKDIDLYEQDQFITGPLNNHLARFNAAGIYYLCYLGNDDLRIYDDLFDAICRQYPFIVNLAQRRYELNGVEFVGMNWVTDYPFPFKDRCRMDSADYVFQEQSGVGLLSTPAGWRELDDWYSYARTLPTIADELKQLVRPQDFAHSVYVIHMPPAGLGLDVCWDGQRVGSRAVNEFLWENQPKLSLHGHIHESPEVSGRWQGKIGETICVQPGQLDPFTYVTIDLNSMAITRHKE